MSLRKRLFNVAKAEIKGAARNLFGSTADHEDRVEEELEEMRKEEASKTPPRKAAARTETAKIRAYYANLELPIGASAAEVKASYRRLMRRYHPDLHQGDHEKAEVATRLAQELRVAYEGLIAYLEPGEPRGRG